MQPVQLKMARAALDLSVDQLARKAGIPPAEVSRIEAGGSVEPEASQSLALVLSSSGIELIDDDAVRARGAGTSDSVPVEQLTTDNDGGQG